METLYDFVRAKVSYENGIESKGAAAALRNGKANHDDLSALFVALCRDADVPARLVWVPEFCYAEFYLVDKHGDGHWLPCSPAGAKAFGEMPDTKLILAKGDNFKPPDVRDRQRYPRANLNAHPGTRRRPAERAVGRRAEQLKLTAGSGMERRDWGLELIPNPQSLTPCRLPLSTPQAFAPIIHGCSRSRRSPMPAQIDLTYDGSLRCRARGISSAATLTSDVSKTAGGLGENFSPTDLVVVALGTCVLTTLAIVAQRHQIDITGLSACMEKDMQTDPPRRIASIGMTITMPLGTRLTPEDRSRLENAARALSGEAEPAPGNRHSRGVRLSRRLPAARRRGVKAALGSIRSSVAAISGLAGVLRDYATKPAGGAYRVHTAGSGLYYFYSKSFLASGKESSIARRLPTVRA